MLESGSQTHLLTAFQVTSYDRRIKGTRESGNSFPFGLQQSQGSSGLFHRGPLQWQKQGDGLLASCKAAARGALKTQLCSANLGSSRFVGLDPSVPFGFS